MKESSAIINALINTSGIVGVQMFGYEWAVYPAMVLICILVFAHRHLDRYTCLQDQILGKATKHPVTFRHQLL